ncbi:MAG: hypothetical protein ACKVQS_13920 [Fimbriimonadaceae bacterium]
MGSLGYKLAEYDVAESCSVAEGVDLYTRGGAVANFEGGWLGVIAEGHGADFQIYDRGALDGLFSPHPPDRVRGRLFPSPEREGWSVENLPRPIAVYRAGERVV